MIIFGKVCARLPSQLGVKHIVKNHETIQCLSKRSRNRFYIRVFVLELLRKVMVSWDNEEQSREYWS